jgi:type I restriction enzyme S subunit
MSVREGYKQTEIGIIPEEWEVVELGDVLDYEQPTKYLVASEEYKDSYETPVLTAGKTFILGYTSEEAGIFNNLPVIIFDDFTTASKYVDFPFKAKSSAMKLLKRKRPDTNLRLIFEYIQQLDFEASTHKRYWISEYQKLRIPLPPLQEQQKIAEILSTVDQKIDSIDSKMEEIKTLKRGLMQRLLSEGIGHSEFKESEIGRIPAGWDYQTFEEAKIQIIDGDRGTNYPKQHDFFQEGFCLFLSAKNVTKRGFEFFEKQFITEEKDSLLRKGKLVKFDIVLTTRGTVGNIAYFDSSVAFENMRINSGMVLIRIQENLDSKYLYKIMTSELIQKNIQNIAFGSAQPQLTVKEIKNFKIPIPPLEEQNQIAEILSTTDEKLETLRAKKEVFETLKKGLMQKLLSGEVRV